MCGIFGTLNLEIANQASEIFNGLAHRGPDEKGFTIKDNVELYHTRLAIQDLSPAGQQPMHHHGLSIVFNGEIYNHLELREKYQLYAESNSDTKTLLMLFERLGMKMLEELDGMFSFALYDQRQKQLFLARDRAGKKPLYTYQKDKDFAFSSELNTLYQIFKPEIDESSLSAYLYLGYHYRKATPYKAVTELENGHYLKIDTQTGKKEIVKWFDMSTCYLNRSKMSYQVALHELDQKLQTAVKRRLDSSDLDVGSFLSGGIDSGIVTAMAAMHKPSLRTFTVKIEGAYDESLLAQKVADRYKTNHTVVDISFDDLKDDIEKILINYGEPFCDSSAIPSYYVAKAAKKHVTVVLNGDGADELFGGYRRYVPYKYHDFFNAGGFSKIAAQTLLSILPVANEKKSKYNYIYRLLKFASYKDILHQYSSASSDIFVGFENQFLQKPNLTAIYEDLGRINQLHLSPLNKLLLMDFQTILFSGLLPKMDIATMAHSLEGRSPFLAKEIIEFVPGLRDDFKINCLSTKFILRDLGRKYLPAELIDQPKRGFEIPLKNWVDNQLKNIIGDYLFSNNTIYPSLIQKKFVEDLWVRKVKISEERRAKILFDVFALEVWYKNINNTNKKPAFSRTETASTLV
ncbi:asparagine synthase (glutamine-hydrolyzing) [Pedobacter cryophilus]|uniref:asparagine synthase (glutamine-hydrolyzing) n=1 Tax=Pedobacter cryophilus TaxID=2571271 RepID=A0A4U1BYG9_9SPHI|nr:asparagine synthase (glutamine-hydrolyzing) [Pedobacter cryophilus]TKB97619.1 asparagine synthase (glutamine-hydrolyzing) [Pedobacter cryophilus]